MDKKIFVLIFCMIFLVSTVSAFEFDNIKSYNQNTKTAVIKNAFGLGDTIAEAKLITPSNFMVSRGYQKVAEFEVKGFQDYNDFIKQLEFYDMKNGKLKITRDYDLKALVYQEVKIKDYKDVCDNVISANGSIDKKCKKEETGSHLENKEVWIDLKDLNIKKDGVLNIGIFTDVQKDDKIEWIPKLFGVKIEEWATWTESLAVNILSYWKFDETSGLIADDFFNDNTLISNNSNWTTGLINNGVGLNRTNGAIWWNDSLLYQDNRDLSFSFWFKLNEDYEAGKGNMALFSKVNEHMVNHISVWLSNSDGKLYMSYEGEDGGNGNLAGTTTSWTNGTWYHVIAKWDTTAGNLSLYKDSTLEANVSYTYHLNASANAKPFRVGQWDEGLGAGAEFNGTIDEFGIWERSLTYGEIQDLYNSGSGISPTVAINVTLNSPANNTKYTSSPQTITFNCSATSSMGVLNLSLLIGNQINYTIYNTTANQNLSLQTNVLMGEGYHNWGCLGANGDGYTYGENRTLTIDQTLPVVSIISPVNDTEYQTIHNTYNVTLNASITDNIGLSNCFYYNETANVSITCNDYTTINLTTGSHTLIYYGNDTVGNIASNQTTFFINQITPNLTYETPVIEGEPTPIYFNMTATNITLITANLTYNNTLYEMTEIFNNGTTAIFQRNITPPFVTSDTNISLWINYSLNSVEGNISFYNQTIQTLSIDNCTTYTNRILNLTIFDEETQKMLNTANNTQIELFVNIYNSERNETLLNLSNQYVDNPTSICLNLNLTDNYNYSLDSTIRYQADGYVNEYYNIVNLTLNGDTEMQNIDLYDLNSSDSTDFRFTFTGSDYQPVESALVYVERQYISENSFKVVELPKTDTNGQTILHLVRNDIVYNIRVAKGGEVLGNFNNLIAFCEDYTIGDCEISLNAYETIEEIFNYDNNLGISFTAPTYDNNTRNVTFTFLSSDGSNKNVNMNVSRSDIFGNRSICNVSVDSASGSLVCHVDENIEDSLIRVTVYVEDTETVTSQVKLAKSDYGVGGYLVLFVFVISFVLMFSDNKTGILISLLISFAGAVGLSVITSSLIGYGAAGLWLIVIIIIALIKLHKERPD